MKNDELAKLRTDYTGDPLAPEAMAADPLDELRQWLAVAKGYPVEDANAATLCTVDAEGMPRGRMVLLKSVDDGLVFFTNYESDKARECDAAGRCSLVFFWQPLGRQVRVEGAVARVSADASDAYFAQRPRLSQLGAWASDQSRPVPDRLALERRLSEAGQRFPDAVPRPPHWGGFRVTPTRVEFWQGHPGRLHDRVVYDGAGAKWTKKRLAP